MSPHKGRKNSKRQSESPEANKVAKPRMDAILYMGPNGGKSSQNTQKLSNDSNNTCSSSSTNTAFQEPSIV